MPYRTGSYCLYGNCSNCIRGTYWFPGGGGDFNDPVRNEITYAYLSLFGRYGETAGVEGWVYTWVYGGGPAAYGSIYNMVRAGGEGSGEGPLTRTFGKHTNMSSSSSCPVGGCTDSRASNYNPSATFDDGSCYYAPPSVSISANPTAIIRGGTTRITWSISNATSASITNIGTVSATGGSTIVAPTSTITYTLNASGLGGSRNASVQVIVYIPPTVTLSLDSETIVRGSSTRLRWTTTGDASTADIQPGIGASNITSNALVSPTVTTTYTAYVSGRGGNDSDEITLTVLQPPDVSLNGPSLINYGDSVTISYEAVNVPTSFTVTPYFYSLDGVETADDPIILPTGDNINGSFTHTPIWDNRGPSQVVYLASVVGYGGLTDTDAFFISVDIDQMPDFIQIPESDDKIKDETPVISPDTVVTTTEILVNDIDIPVEIKSDLPVQVEIDNDGIYRDVRRI